MSWNNKEEIGTTYSTVQQWRLSMLCLSVITVMPKTEKFYLTPHFCRCLCSGYCQPNVGFPICSPHNAVTNVRCARCDRRMKTKG